MAEAVFDQRFAWIEKHGGPVVGWVEASKFRHDVVGDGLMGWFSCDEESGATSISLSKHIDGENGLRMLGLSLQSNPALSSGPVHWSSTLRVGKSEDRYVRARGYSPDFPTALSQAEGYSHESRQMGGLTWWLESEGVWVSWAGPFSLRALKMGWAGEDSYWRYEVYGDAPTLEEAAVLAVLGRAAGVGGG